MAYNHFVNIILIKTEYHEVSCMTLLVIDSNEHACHLEMNQSSDLDYVLSFVYQRYVLCLKTPTRATDLIN